MSAVTAEALRALAEDGELIEVARKAIEDELIEWRDSMMFTICGNGFAIRGKDGTPSPIIRFRTDVGLCIALEAIAKHLEAKA